MNNPKWISAPKWANWLAQDKGGDWAWYEQRPVACSVTEIWEWINPLSSEWRLARSDNKINKSWQETLEQRP